MRKKSKQELSRLAGSGGSVMRIGIKQRKSQLRGRQVVTIKSLPPDDTDRTEKSESPVVNTRTCSERSALPCICGGRTPGPHSAFTTFTTRPPVPSSFMQRIVYSPAARCTVGKLVRAPLRAVPESSSAPTAL